MTGVWSGACAGRNAVLVDIVRIYVKDAYHGDITITLNMLMGLN